MQHKLIIMNPNEDINPLADEIKNLEAKIANIDITNLDPSDNMKAIVTETNVTEPKVEAETTSQEEVKAPASEVTEDPIKTELEKVKGQTQGKTPQEKMAYKLKLELQKAKEMGIDVEEVLGVKKPETTTSDDNFEDKPLTRKDLDEVLKNINKPYVKSASELAIERIENESERELTLYYLDNKIKSSGDPEQDYQDAKMLVDAIKVKQHLAMSENRPEVKNYTTVSSVKIDKNQAVKSNLTPEEQVIFNDAQVRGVSLTKEDIIALRK